jgi:hypothetical protein
MKTKIIFILGILVLFSTGVFAQTDQASAAVQSFYKFHRSRSDVFDTRQVALRKPWFSSDLNGLFQYELKREKAFFKKNPNEKPFFGDGFPFQPLDECYKAGKSINNLYKVGATALQDQKAVVEVQFYAPKVCGGYLIDSYKVELVKNNGKWLINDWVYPDGQTLIADLKRKEY